MRGGAGVVAPDPTWGVPAAAFPVGDWCGYDAHFDPHVMVFDLTFCGDWAGADFPASGCGGDCNDRTSPLLSVVFSRR